MKSHLMLGCVADDFTGASDAASFLMAGGLNTVLCNGIPKESFHLPESCEAVVIALKSRTQPTKDAVSDSVDAVRWMKKRGAGQFYVKYCSTFDSTPQGNIGPVVDALLDELDAHGTILCPALPANGRTVEDGILYVNGIPLAESSMKDHPLTPMRESRIAQLMAPQGQYPSLELHSSHLHGDRTALQQKIREFTQNKKHYYVIPDHRDDADADLLIELFGDMPLLSGGSGLLTSWARYLKKGREVSVPESETAGNALILAGSCSTATNAQTNWFKSKGGLCVRLEDQMLLDGNQNAASIWSQISDAKETPLVYSYETPQGLMNKRDETGKRLSALIERTLSEVAVLAMEQGVTRIIVAGGETSGAVTKSLGFSAFQIGKSVAPGVPILIPIENQKIRLVLKSGNFGQEDFFGRALDMTEKKERA